MHCDGSVWALPGQQCEETSQAKVLDLNLSCNFNACSCNLNFRRTPRMTWDFLLLLLLCRLSCPTLCHPRDGSPPDSPVPGILQARTLVWVAISFSNAWKWKVKGKSLSRVQLLATPWTAAHQAPPSIGFFKKIQVFPACRMRNKEESKFGHCTDLDLVVDFPGLLTHGVLFLNSLAFSSIKWKLYCIRGPLWRLSNVLLIKFLVYCMLSEICKVYVRQRINIPKQ